MEGKIQRITVPDEHVIDWMQTLREGGFTDAEIDSILSHLNATYAGVKRHEYIEKELARINEEIKGRRRTDLTPEESKAIRQGIESRFAK